MAANHDPLLPQCFYHLYSRANGQEKLFKSEENYRFFLSKYLLHTTPVADTFAYCLLPDHFHFLIQCKPLDVIEYHYTLVKQKQPSSPVYLSDFIMERFSNWLNSYTKAFNKMQVRKGSLFVDYMRRQPVLDLEQLRATTSYIHHNPVHHRHARAMGEWRWSSYNTFFSAAQTTIQRTRVLDWFGGITAFGEYHRKPVLLQGAVYTEG